MARSSFSDRTLAPGIPTDSWIHDGDNGESLGSNPKLSTDGTPKDYFIEVAEGNIEGASLLAIIAKNPNTGVNYEDVSGAGGNMSLATSPEVYEIVSSNANDTDGGTGTRTVLVNSLDANYNEQSQVVTLNGGTVQLTGTHIRPRNIQSLTAGSNGTNIGNITLRVSGGGGVRNTMTADSGQSYDGHFTVPAGKKAYILQSFTLFAKDDSGSARTRFRLDGVDSSWVAIAPAPVYQNIINFEVKALLAFPPKTDIRNQAKSDTGTSDAIVIFEYQLRNE